MQILNIKTVKRIEANKSFLEKRLKVKIEISGRKIEISGNEYKRYIAERIIEAMDKNFSIDTALFLQSEEYVFESINIKDHTRKKDISTVIARVLGKKGRTIEIMGDLSNCELTLKDNYVSIIGPAEKIKYAINAVISIIGGAKTSKIYAYLEKARKRYYSEDLGLKIKSEEEKDKE